MKPNFRFKIIKKKQFLSDGHSKYKRSSFLKRFIARKMALILFENGADTYQFGGCTGTLKKSYELVNADKFQLIHWILRSVGYDCCSANIEERCNVNNKGN